MNNVSIKIKLIIGMIMLILISSISGITGYWGMMDAKSSLEKITNVYLPNVAELGKLQYHFKSILLAQTMLLKRNITVEQRNKQYADIKRHRELYLEATNKIEKLPRDKVELISWNNFKDTLTAARHNNDKVFTMIREWETDEDNMVLYQKAFDYAYNDADKVNERLLSEIQEIVTTTNENADITKMHASDEMDHNSMMILIVFVLASSIGIGISFYIVRKIIKPLNEILHAAEEFSKGDFTIRIDTKSNDEIGKTSQYLNIALDVVVAKMLWYENIVNSINFPIVVMDNDKNITFVNAALTNILHIDKDKLLYKPCSDLMTSICHTDQCAIDCAKKRYSY